MSAAPPIRLVPQPSPALQRALCVAHVLGALLAAHASPGRGMTCLLCAALACHLAASLRALRHAGSGLLAVACDGSGRWRLQWRDGRSEPAAPHGAPFVSSWLVCLRLRARGRSTVLLLAHDNADAASLRRLRARLAWQGATASESGALAPREP